MKTKLKIHLLGFLLLPLIAGLNIAEAYPRGGPYNRGYNNPVYHNHGNYRNTGYYWQGKRYNYYYNGRYYNYYNKGHYYNYYNKGRYYNRCSITPGYRAYGVWYPPVKRCW